MIEMMKRQAMIECRNSNQHIASHYHRLQASFRIKIFKVRDEFCREILNDFFHTAFITKATFQKTVCQSFLPFIVLQ